MSFRGRGYIVGSEQDFRRLQSQIKTSTLVSLFLVGAFASLSNLAGYVVAALVFIFCTIRSRYQVRGMQPSLERQSPKQRLALLARVLGARGLWVLEISSLVLVCGSVLLFVDPDQKHVAWTGLLLFGSCSALYGYQLILLHREGPEPRSAVD